MSAILNPNHRRGRAPCGHMECPDLTCRFDKATAEPCTHPVLTLEAIERDGKPLFRCPCGHEFEISEADPFGPWTWNGKRTTALACELQRGRS